MMNFEQIYKLSKLKEADEKETEEKSRYNLIFDILFNYFTNRNYTYFIHYEETTKKILYGYEKFFSNHKFDIFTPNNFNYTVTQFGNKILRNEHKPCNSSKNGDGQLIAPFLVDRNEFKTLFKEVVGSTHEEKWNIIDKSSGRDQKKSKGSEVLNSLADAIGGQ